MRKSVLGNHCKRRGAWLTSSGLGFPVKVFTASKIH